MDGAKALPSATPGTPLAAAWASAFPSQVAIRWNGIPLPPQYAPFASRLAEVRAGGWVQADVQPNRFVATVELESRAPTPITLPAFRLRWAEGLSLKCEPATPGQRHQAVASQRFVCEGWGPPAQRDAFALGAPSPDPGHLDTPDDWRALLRAIASANPRNTNDWVDRLQGRPDARERQAARQAEQRAAYRWYRDRALLRQIKDRALIAGGVLLAFGLLVVGRRWRREGSSAAVVGTMTVGVMAVAAVVTLVALWEPPSGEGWARAGPLILVIWVGSQFIVATVVLLLLHRLLDRLDEDNQGWGATIAGAWARILQFRGQATRGEFWGYVGFWFAAALAIGVVIPPVAPVTTLLLALPLPALTWRRFNALSAAETWGLVALAALLLLNLLAER